jgi:hypothetical protein
MEEIIPVNLANGNEDLPLISLSHLRDLLARGHNLNERNLNVLFFEGKHPSEGIECSENGL